MTTPNPQARRATIEDLPKLMPLWTQEGLPADDLAKRLQEFQVVEGADGGLTGALGLRISGQEAELHSEAFARPEDAEAARAALWERVQVVAKNHGFVRLWTQIRSPFWGQHGFRDAAPEVAEKLPRAFTGADRPWHTLLLRDEAALAPSIDKEFALFKEMQREETERIQKQAKTLKVIAMLVVIAVFVLLIVWVFYWMKTQQRLRGR